MKVAKTDGCWLWLAAINVWGYGRFVINGKNLLAHRVAWTLGVGPIPDGMDVLHHCDVKACVRYDEHLYLGTDSDNQRDAYARGRKHPVQLFGEQHGLSALTDDQRRLIVARYLAGGRSQQHLAVEFGVSQTTVGRIVRSGRWS